LNALRAENERLRALVEDQSHALAQVRTQAEQERLAGQRQETLKNIDINELLNVVNQWSFAGAQGVLF